MDSSADPLAEALTPADANGEALKPVDPGIPVRPDRVPAPEDNDLTRRTALKMFSATALMSTLAGCTRKPKRHIISMVDRPEYRRAGSPIYYATTWTEGPWPFGMRVKSVDGRPVKIEGLPGHPLNDSRSNAQMQATTLSLYDPNRLKTPEQNGKEATFDAVDKLVVDALRNAQKTVLITRANLGPSERALVTRFKKAGRGVQHFVHEGSHDAARRAAWTKLYGADGAVTPNLAKAKLIVSLDADFLGTDGNAIRATREFAAGRRVTPGENTLSRLYVAESAMTITGTNADHRLPVRPAAMYWLADALQKAVLSGNEAGLKPLVAEQGLDAAVLAALVKDLVASKGKGDACVVVGPQQPAAIHAAAAKINAFLGAGGQTLEWNATPPTLPISNPGDVRGALDDAPDVVILLGVNPVYDAIGSGFADLLGKAKLTVGHGLTKNETLSVCSIALPSAHNLESWNDAVPAPGVETLCQPLIAPLFDGRQDAESLLTWTVALEGSKNTDWHNYIRERWTTGRLAGQGPGAWETALRTGITGTATAAPFPALNTSAANELAGTVVTGTGFDVVVRPHHAVGDGRDAGNAWLLELPDPISKLVWDNAVAVGPKTAKKLGVAEGDWVKIENGGFAVEAPVLIQPGTAPDTLICTLGHGRTAGAGLGDDWGYNAAPIYGDGTALLNVTVGKSGRKHLKLVRTQETFSQHNRPLARSGDRAEYDEHPDFAAHRSHTPELVQIDPEWDYSKGHKWGLAIDLNQCTGCSACLVACQSENNVAVVGKDEVGRGREMNWIRLDRYESGSEDNPTVDQQPMLCQHCDNAPCENVCPVNATAHSPEGLNDQVYNRCVGTRYCSNNCPYKVRRFNYYNYTRRNVTEPVQEMVFNPQVTVRMRGVMEKCTFCVQRINAGRHEESKSGKPMKDGAIVTACQEACPADAIVFGDANDPKSRLAEARKSSLGYHVLDELNVRPNVTYLAKVRNPNPTVPSDNGHDKGGH